MAADGQSQGTLEQQQAIQAAPSAPTGPILPWQQRRQIGRARAYWRTLWLVVRRNGRLGEYLDGPVDARDARRFRLVTALLAMVPGIVMLRVVLWAVRDELPSVFEVGTPVQALSLSRPFVTQLLSLFSIPLCIGAVSWFFHRSHKPGPGRDRALALSCYVCAPMALSSVLLITPLLTYVETCLLSGSWPTPGEVLGAGPFGETGKSTQVLVWTARNTVASAASGVASATQALATALWIYWYQMILFSVRSIARRRVLGIILTAIALPVAWVLIDLDLDWLAIIAVMAIVLVCSWI